MTSAEINGKIRLHCGCQKKKEVKPLYGLERGYLKAIMPIDKADKGYSAIWQCQCRCGNTCFVSAGDFMRGKKQSCGCKKRENQKMIGQRRHYIDGTCIERLGQKAPRSDNKSGVCGVRVTENGHYTAYIGFKGKRYSLGTYNMLSMAEKVRLDAVKRFHTPVLEEFNKNT